jgi:lipoprotein-anchoring transpeptidase ErfK/SrfK
VLGEGRWGAAVVAALLVLTTACGGGDDGSAAGDTAGSGAARRDAAPTTTEAGGSGSETAEHAAPGSTVARVAQAVPTRIQVYVSPSADEPKTVLDNPNENGAPLVFLVDRDLGDWLEVLLPIRPNGSTGFVRATDVTLADNPYRIGIDLGDHRLVVRERGQVLADEPIGVGTASTPTPGGRYYIKELLQPPDPTGPYGPYAYGLSGFSNVIDEFNGGDGVIGIHGTNEPEAIGTDVSHGCIRMSNEAITRLTAILPLGTPVHIEA